MKFFQTAVALTSLLFAANAWADDGAWRIVQSTGVVKAGASGFTPAAVRPNESLQKDSWVETGETGRVVLVRGVETIALGPNSRVQLPAQEVNGNTQVLQTLGSALYQIGKQKQPHFQVDTPYLAAVVKGTTFTVTVGEAASAVEVTEGLVEVATPDGSDTEYVSPGFTGVVSKNDRSNVTVVVTKHDPAAPDGAPGKSGDKSASKASNGNDRAVIATAIGETVIDVKEVSGGLANGADNAVANGNGFKVGLVAGSEGSADETGTSNSSSNNGNSSSNNGNSSSSNGNSASVVAAVDLGSGNGNANANGLGNGNAGGSGESVAASVEIETGSGNGVALGLSSGNGGGNGNGASVDLGSVGTVEVGGNGLGLDLGVGNGPGSSNAGGNGNSNAGGNGNSNAGGNGGNGNGNGNGNDD